MMRSTGVSWEAPTEVDPLLSARERAVLALRRAATALRCANERHPTVLRALEIAAIERELHLASVEQAQ